MCPNETVDRPAQTGDPHPAEILHGRHTADALRNFGVSGRPVAGSLIRAIAHIKAAAAMTNADESDRTGVDGAMADAIVAAADAIVGGEHADQFPVDVYQTGSGTSTNMNVNEVIATLATRSLGRAVHPNDHVNASQSTNDVIPTAIRIAALELLDEILVPGLTRLEFRLEEKAREFAGVVKAGRTHLMDATPLMLGDEFAGYRSQVADAMGRLAGTEAHLGSVPLGGTAVGTGLNASRHYQRRVVAVLAERTGLVLRSSPSRMAAQGSHDDVVDLSARVRGAAVAIYKIANDLRLLASGPRTGFGELILPDLQAGSSIMPGKTNPVICEVALQVAARVLGNDATIAFAGTQGDLELNVFQPLIADTLFESIQLLGRTAFDLADRCVAGIQADVEQCRRHAEATPALATALTPLIGYDAATAVVAQALAERRPIHEVAVEHGVAAADAARHLDPVRLATDVGTRR